MRPFYAGGRLATGRKGWGKRPIGAGTQRRSLQNATKLLNVFRNYVRLAIPAVSLTKEMVGFLIPDDFMFYRIEI